VKKNDRTFQVVGYNLLKAYHVTLKATPILLKIRFCGDNYTSTTRESFPRIAKAAHVIQKILKKGTDYCPHPKPADLPDDGANVDADISSNSNSNSNETTNDTMTNQETNIDPEDPDKELSNEELQKYCLKDWEVNNRGWYLKY